MVKLKQITCSIELGTSKTKLQEYGHNYSDGYVECFIPVVDAAIPFAVHVESSGYIAPGLAAFVFIDGEYQANRNIMDLEMPRDGVTTPKNRLKADLFFRQKEEKTSQGTFIGREWTFSKLKTAIANEAPNLNAKFMLNPGTIEVIILRCADQDEPTPRNPPFKAIDLPKPASSSEKVAMRDATPTASIISGLGITGIFDGVHDDDDRADHHPAISGNVNQRLPDGYMWDPRRGRLIRFSELLIPLSGAGVPGDVLPGDHHDGGQPSTESIGRPVYSGPQWPPGMGRDDRRGDPYLGATGSARENLRRRRRERGESVTDAPSATPDGLGDAQMDGYGRLDDNLQPPQAGFQQAPGGFQPAHGGFQAAQAAYQPAYGGYPPAQQGYPPAQQGYPMAQPGFQQAGLQQAGFQHAPYGHAYGPQPQQPAIGAYGAQGQAPGQGATHLPQDPPYSSELFALGQQVQAAERNVQAAFRTGVEANYQAAQQYLQAAQLRFWNALAHLRNPQGQNGQPIVPPNVAPVFNGQAGSSDGGSDIFWGARANPNGINPFKQRRIRNPAAMLRHHAPQPWPDAGFLHVGQGVAEGPYGHFDDDQVADKLEQKNNEGAWGNPSTSRHDTPKRDALKAMNEVKLDPEAQRLWDEIKMHNGWVIDESGENLDGWDGKCAIKQQGGQPTKSKEQEQDHGNGNSNPNDGGGGWAEQGNPNDDVGGWSDKKNSKGKGRVKEDDGWGNQTHGDKQATQGWNSASKINKGQSNDKAWDAGGNGGWSVKDQQQGNNSGGWDAITPNKTPSVAAPQSRAPSDTTITPEGYIKSYWKDWRQAPDPQAGSGSDARKKRHEPRPVYEYPAPSPPSAPAKLLGDADYGVQLGKGAEYAHSARKPQYLDTMEAPYAVFSFKYRSKVVLEKRLKIDIDADAAGIVAQAEKELLMQMSKTKLVDELLKARTPPGAGKRSVSERGKTAGRWSGSNGHSKAGSKTARYIKSNEWGSGGDGKEVGWDGNADTPTKGPSDPNRKSASTAVQSKKQNHEGGGLSDTKSFPWDGEDLMKKHSGGGGLEEGPAGW